MTKEQFNAKIQEMLPDLIKSVSHEAEMVNIKQTGPGVWLVAFIGLATAGRANSHAVYLSSDGQWRCECGVLDCNHIQAVKASLVNPRVQNAVKSIMAQFGLHRPFLSGEISPILEELYDAAFQDGQESPRKPV